MKMSMRLPFEEFMRLCSEAKGAHESLLVILTFPGEKEIYLNCTYFDILNVF